MTWAGYLTGKNNPVNKSIDLVEKVLPGTSLNFYKGPNGIELWKVLSGDVKEAAALLDSALRLEHGHHVDEWDLAEGLLVRSAHPCLPSSAVCGSDG